MTKEKNIIGFVMGLPSSSIDSIRRYEKVVGKSYRIALLWDKKYLLPERQIDYDVLIIIDFSKPEKISEALAPYEKQFLALSCRSEANIARFAKIIPNVPYLRTPTSESLTWATDKYEMRKRFRAYDSTITPVFTLIKENNKQERARVIAKVGFPMIVKPTNLAGSLFVQICYHEDELEKALANGFRKIRKAYEKDKRIEEPKIIAEQFMEGDMYSIDSYVDSRGLVYHCPLVRVKTGRDIGHKDFFGYLQLTPTILKSESIERARLTTEKAIHALGLRSCSAHTELMKVDTEWKVVEVGPRVGGARDVLYSLSCDIDHSLNDVLIRIPKKPQIPKKCKGYAAYMKWYATKEGVITEMKGIKKIEQLESFHNIVVNKKIGDRFIFASHGGRSVFNLYLYNDERSKLLADIRRIEQLVEVKVSRIKTTGSTLTSKSNTLVRPLRKIKRQVKKLVTAKVR